ACPLYGGIRSATIDLFWSHRTENGMPRRVRCRRFPDRFSGLAALPPDRRFAAFDYPGLKISIAEYDEGPTGCTVLSFDAPATCVSDIRGGAPGFLGGYGVADAICFAGGSLCGLAAATRVSAEILKERGNARWGQIACVQSAIIYDFGARPTTVYPDKALGA